MSGVKTVTTALTIFNSATVGKKPTRAGLIATTLKAIENERTSTWRTAVMVYKAVHCQDFDKLFQTKAEYAEAIGYKESYVTRLSRAVDMYLMLVHLDDTFENVSVGFVMELLPLCKKEIDGEILDDFLHVSQLKPTDNRDIVRNAVKEYRGLCEQDINSQENVSRETLDTSDADNISNADNISDADDALNTNDMRIEFDGGTLTIPQGQLYNDILALLAENGVQF